MEKYLFTDGTNVIREVESKEELNTLIQSAVDPEKIRVWVFNTSEWVSYTEFSKLPVAKNIVSKKTIYTEDKKEDQLVEPKRVKRYGWLKRSAIAVIAAGTIFLVYNFTKISWTKTSSLDIVAARPENAPPINVDSLIQSVEYSRGKKLDKITATNLRIRNTWPDRLELQLTADRDSSSAGLQYYNIELTIDNSTGYNIDNAISKVTAWKNEEAVSSDTVHFNDITYAAAATKSISNRYRGDSLSVSFISIKAKTFNFCYSSDKKSNYGNLNDRWFCRE